MNLLPNNGTDKDEKGKNLNTIQTKNGRTLYSALVFDQFFIWKLNELFG